MWMCPICLRMFRYENQQHTCGLSDLDAKFVEKPDALRKTYDKLESVARSFGPIYVEPMASVILFKAPCVFMEIRVKKDHLALLFILKRRIEEFPISRIVSYTKHKRVHFLEIDSPSQVNDQLISWLRESYLLNKVESETN